jgi:hypothetical protein
MLRTRFVAATLVTTRANASLSAVDGVGVSKIL